MPIARYQMPDGRIARFEVPEGTTPEQAQSMMGSFDFESQEKPPEPKTGVSDFAGASIAGAADAASFGFGDEMSAGIKAPFAYLGSKIAGTDKSLGTVYNEQLQQNRAADKAIQERNPIGYGAGEVAGIIGGGLLGAGTKAGAATARGVSRGLLPNATSGIGKAANAVSKAGVAGAAGATTAGVSGFGAGEGVDNRLQSAEDSAVAGGAISAALPVAGSLARKVIGGGSTAKLGAAARGADDLKEASLTQKKLTSAAYKKVDEAGAVINQDSAKALVSDIEKNLAGVDIIPELNPKTLGVLNRIKQAAESGDLKVTQIDQYRRLLRKIGNSEDGLTAGKVRGSIDSFLDNLDETKLSGGDANAGKYLREARDAAAQGFRFDSISKIVRKADGDPNKIKSGLTSFLNKYDGNPPGFNKEEIAALKEAASSTTTEKLLKMGGKFGFDFGTSLTSGNTVAPIVGGTVGGIAGGAGTAGLVPVVGTAARYGQKLAARGKAEKLLKTIEGKTAKPSNLPTKIEQKIIPNSSGATGRAMGSQSEPTVIPPEQIPPQSMQQMQPQVSNDVLNRIQQAESGGNQAAKNPSSSASGIYQFTNATWNSVVDKYGARYGITRKDKNNPEAQQLMAERLTEENGKALAKRGIEPTDQNLYLAHFLGAPAATKAIESLGKGVPAAQLFPKAAASNQSIFFDNSGKPKTIDEVYAIIGQKVGV